MNSNTNNNSSNNKNNQGINNERNTTSQNSNNNPMDPRNFLNNIGTPSFSITQIPQPILQSLTPVQLRTIQQKHQQLLASRIQQQQQQQQNNNNNNIQIPVQSPEMQNNRLQRSSNMENDHSSSAAIMQQMNVQQRLAQMSEQTKQATAQALQQQRQKLQEQQQQQQARNASRITDNTPPINLPPQIAALPLPQQLQILNSLKAQAISKGNMAIVSTIMMAQRQVQERLQQQIQQQQQINDPNNNIAPNTQNNVNSGGSNQFINMQTTQSPNEMNNFTGLQQSPLPPNTNIPTTVIPTNNSIPEQMSPVATPTQRKTQAKGRGRKNQNASTHNLARQHRKHTTAKTSKKASNTSTTPASTISQPTLPTTTTTTMPTVAGLQIPTNVPPLSMPKLELPEYKTIKYNPPEAKLPYTEYWSESKGPTTDSLLYEQFIRRDKHDVEGKEKEKGGYEPFSIYGFSNREYMAKLFHTLKYYQELKNTRMKSITSTTKNIPAASIWGSGYSGYGNGISNTITKIISGYKDETQLDELAIHKQAMNETSEELVPIRLEFDQEKDKFFLRDTFLWNRNETVVSIENFVHEMVKDFRFNKSYRAQFGDMIAQSIREQIYEYQPNPYNELKRRRLGGDDLRIKIKLDIVVGQNQLIDQFEWDISNTDNCAEEFAENMCQELQLPGEFVTAISHSIREQVHMYHKSLALLGYKFDGSPVEDNDIRSRLLPVITLDDVFRVPSDTKNYTPNLLQISIAELERLDRDKERDTRRKRRQGRLNRRGNVTSGNVLNSISSNNGLVGPLSGSSLTNDNYLPDVADIPRTFRTPIPSTVLPGGIDLGPSVNSYDLNTIIEYKPRPLTPNSKPRLCYIMSHIPGQSLRVCINIKKKTTVEADSEKQDYNNDVNKRNADGINENLSGNSTSINTVKIEPITNS